MKRIFLLLFLIIIILSNSNISNAKDSFRVIDKSSYTLNFKKDIFRLYFRPNHKDIFFNEEYKNIVIWDIEKNIKKVLFESKNENESYYLGNFSNDGKYVLIGHNSDSEKKSEFFIYNINQKLSIKTILINYNQNFMKLTYSPSNKYIAIKSSGVGINIYDTKNNYKLIQNNFYVVGNLFDLKFKDDTYIASAYSDNRIRLWNIKNGKKIQDFIGLEYMNFTKDGKYFLYTSFEPFKPFDSHHEKSDDYILKNTKSGKIREITSLGRGIDFTPDSKLIMIENYKKTKVSIDFYTIKDLKKVLSIIGNKEDLDFREATISSDSKYLALSISNKGIVVWKL